MQAVRRADQLSKPAPARVVVGMNMRVDDVCDPDISLVRFIDKPLLIAGNDVDGDCLAGRCTTEEVRKRGVEGGDLPEEHTRENSTKSAIDGRDGMRRYG